MSVCVCVFVFVCLHVHIHVYLKPISIATGFQPLILGHQRVIGGHYVVNGDRHDRLQVSCNSVCTIFVDYMNCLTTRY